MGTRRGLMRTALALLLAWTVRGETAHFHHVHLNATDPAAALRFYTTKFDCQESTFAGKAAVWTQKSWLLLDKARRVADASESPIWHIGWGAEDMPATYERQVQSGTVFRTPLTDISDLANFKGFFYAYVDGPDHALIELNTARHHHFGHLHLFSADPHAAADWYEKYFGVKPRKSRPEPRMYRNVQVAPSATFQIDNVNVIVYPAGYRGHQRFRSTRGTVFDHVAFSVDHLDDLWQRMQKDGVRLLEKPKKMKGVKQRSFLVEGPDQMALEVVEGHASKP